MGSSLCVYASLGSEDGPTGVLLNGVALLFLCDLDDIGKGLSFIDGDDWSPDALGWFYDYAIDCTDRGNHQRYTGFDSGDDEFQKEWEAGQDGDYKETNARVYEITIIFCM